MRDTYCEMIQLLYLILLYEIVVSDRKPNAKEIQVIRGKILATLSNI